MKGSYTTENKGVVNLSNNFGYLILYNSYFGNFSIDVSAPTNISSSQLNVFEQHNDRISDCRNEQNNK